MGSEVQCLVEELLDEFQAEGRSDELNIRAFRLALAFPHLVEVLCGTSSFVTNLPLVTRWQGDEAAVKWLGECYSYALPILARESGRRTLCLRV